MLASLHQHRANTLGPILINLYYTFVRFMLSFLPVDRLLAQTRSLLVQQSDWDDFNYDDYPLYDKIAEYEESVPSPYWTDIFLYWYDQKDVIEGSVRAFFSDMNPELTT